MFSCEVFHQVFYVRLARGGPLPFQNISRFFHSLSSTPLPFFSGSESTGLSLLRNKLLLCANFFLFCIYSMPVLLCVCMSNQHTRSGRIRKPLGVATFGLRVSWGKEISFTFSSLFQFLKKKKKWKAYNSTSKKGVAIGETFVWEKNYLRVRDKDDLARY